MADVAHIHVHRDMPRMEVLDLGVAAAVSRRMFDDDDGLVDELRYWFMLPIAPTDVRASLSRMAAQGWLREGERLVDAASGKAVLAHYYGSCIRMLDKSMKLVEAGILLKITSDITKGFRHNED